MTTKRVTYADLLACERRAVNLEGALRELMAEIKETQDARECKNGRTVGEENLRDLYDRIGPRGYYAEVLRENT